MKALVLFLLILFAAQTQAGSAYSGKIIGDYYPNQTFFVLADSRPVPSIGTGLNEVSVMRTGKTSSMHALTTYTWEQGDVACIRTFEFTGNSHYVGSSMPFAIPCPKQK